MRVWQTSLTRLGGVLAAATAVFVAASFLSLPALGQAGDGRVVISDGHVDIGPRVVDGAWTVQLKNDNVSPPAWLDLDSLVLHAPDTAVITVPAGEQFGFLGAEGADVWLLPQTQQAGIVWPGWNTQDPSVTAAVNGPVKWTLDAVEGPGEFVLFLTGSFGASTVLFNSADPLPQSMSIELDTHVHGNWAFTAPGIYRLSTTMSATAQSGEPFSHSAVLTVAVGAVDPLAAASATPSGAPQEEPSPVQGQADEEMPGTADGGQGDTSPALIALAAVVALGVAAAALFYYRRSEKGGRPKGTGAP